MNNQDFINKKVEEFEDRLGGVIATQSKREKQDKDNEWFRQTLQEQKQEILEEIKGMRKEVPLEGSQAPSLNYNLALEDIKQIINNH